LAEAVNKYWPMDFIHDLLGDGQSYRLFNVIDGFNREWLIIKTDFSLLTEKCLY